MPVEAINPFLAFMQGKELREQERQRAMQAEQQGLQGQILRQRLEAQPAQMADEAKLRALEIQGAEQQVAGQQDARKQRAYQQIGSLAQQAIQSGNPRQFVKSAAANPAYQGLFQAAGIDPSRIPVDAPEFEQDLAGWASMGPQVSPEARFQAQQRDADRSEDQKFTAEQNRLNREAQAARQVPGQASAQLITRPGPDGQLQDLAFDPRTREITPVGDPYQKQAPLSPKDTTIAKNKLTTLSIARKQIADAREKYQAIKDSFSAGPGGSLVPTPSGKAFDAAIDAMRGTLTSILRVPGVGAMSNYETLLDQSKFPQRGDYEEVIQQKLGALDDTIAALESGYSDMLGGQSDVDAPTDQTPRAQASPEAIKFLKANPQLKEDFRKKYGYLPPGF